MKLKRLRLFSVLVLLFVQSVAAQDAPPVNPLLELMTYVPESSATRSAFITYQDFRAAEDSREYLSRPANAEAFFDSDVPLMVATSRWYGAPPDISQSFLGLLGAENPSFVEAMGFDVFAINRTLTFGDPPAQGVVWSGDFDPQAIAAAHSARGYSRTEIGGVPAWCGPEGCDSGTVIDLQQIGFPNLFSFSLPRPVPFLQPDATTLVSSPARSLLSASASVSTGAGQSIAVSPDYAALARAITDPAEYSGQLVSAIFLPALRVQAARADAGIAAALFDPALTMEARQALLENPEAPAFLAEYGTLPPYLNVVIADRQEGEMQIAIIALAYESNEAAAAGAAELAARLAVFNDGLRSSDPEADPLIDRFEGQAVIEQRVVAAGRDAITGASISGASVAVVEVWYPQASPEEELAALSFTALPGSTPTFPAAYFQWLWLSIRSDSFYPLWSITE